MVEDYKIIRRETVYSGRAFTVEKVFLHLPDQRESQYDLVQHSGAVTILPLDRNGTAWFVEQYRIGAQAHLLELPAGVLKPGEDPGECALRELREEIGKSAHSLVKLGEFFMAPGYTTEKMHVYLARDLFEDPLQQDDDEFLHLVGIPIQDAYRLINDGKLIDGKSLAAFMLAQPVLSKES